MSTINGKPSFLSSGTEIFYRNTSAGGGTLIHLTRRENGSQFCGYSTPTGEHVIVDDTDFYLESQVCKKCYRLFLKTIKQQQ